MGETERMTALNLDHFSHPMPTSPEVTLYILTLGSLRPPKCSFWFSIFFKINLSIYLLVSGLSCGRSAP